MHFDALCRQLNLGAMTEAPVPLGGGLLHRMYAIVTDSGRYAVKRLNAHVMARADAHANFATAEAWERKLEGADLPILPALTIGGRKMQEMDGEYFYVFPYFDGTALTDEDITPAHCAIVGSVLARLHSVEPAAGTVPREDLAFDWDAFDLSPADKNLLRNIQKAANEAALPPLLTICHNDMDPKNVLWNGMECRIIDLECLHDGSPYLELLETALCWAGYESGAVDWGRFRAFVSAYIRAGGNIDADWTAVYHRNTGRLGWLAYNLRRAAGSEGEDARDLGKAEAEKTLACIRGYARIENELVNMMEDIKKEGSV